MRKSSRVQEAGYEPKQGSSIVQRSASAAMEGDNHGSIQCRLRVSDRSKHFKSNGTSANLIRYAPYTRDCQMRTM